MYPAKNSAAFVIFAIKVLMTVIIYDFAFKAFKLKINYNFFISLVT